MVKAMGLETNERAIATSASIGPWLCCAHRPGLVDNPALLNEIEAIWMPATVPGTVASTLAANNRWSFENPPEIDTEDWWFVTSFQHRKSTAGTSTHLCFDGLATLAEVWLNGELLLTTDNMFRTYCVDVSDRLKPENRLIIGFRSVSENLKVKRPRPRWKTNLVNNQQLRWHRTSLQGRIPGWSPPVPAIGPWRGIRLISGPIIPQHLTVCPRLEGATGVVTVDGQLQTSNSIDHAFLQVGDHVQSLQLEPTERGYVVRGTVNVPNVRTWLPHTHGQPYLYECELFLESNGVRYRIPCESLGFRNVQIASADGFQVVVNGQPVYCRGACWTVSDILTLSGTEDQLRHDLTLARDAGVNMLRVGGTMVYENDAFYRLCDELGILVWQDFMFANMDYPVDEESFRNNILAEVSGQLRRLAAHASVVIYCGNSEIEQQAAMLGMPREIWTNSWFAQELPELCGQLHPGCGYVPSTPTGGVLPFHPESGLTHYYGVGAYLRPASDVRRSNVKFTPECLGFSNIPEASILDEITQGGHAVMHDARWKRRVPRDIGAGWDFEDVRDHYLKEIFNVDPVQLRSWDTPKYLQLSRLVPGEMMQQAFSEWRSSHSRNQGGLVWFYKDLWPAAGWGLIDSKGMPKSAYYHLKRVWQSKQLILTDEGLNGLHIHLVNETSQTCEGTVQVQLLKQPNIVVARQELVVRIEGASRRTLSADEILGGFYDASYAYRFGPAHHDVVIVTWFDSGGQVISEAFHFIRRTVPAIERAVTLQSSAEVLKENEYQITLETDRFLQGVTVNAKGFLPDDNYFHLPPQRKKTVTFRALPGQVPPFKALIEAINMESSHVVSARPKST